MNSRAIFRMAMGFSARISFWPLTGVLEKDPRPLGLTRN